MKPTRESLLHNIRNLDNTKAWTEFVDIYRPVIVRTARRHNVSPVEIDDVVQDVFVQVMKSRTQFQYDRSKGRFRNWIQRVTINKIRDRQRKASRNEHSLHCPEQLIDNAESEKYWNEELQRQLYNMALEKVRRETLPKTWLCFAEHCLRHKKAAEVAKRLGVSENAVYVNCSRVVSRIRQHCGTL